MGYIPFHPKPLTVPAKTPPWVPNTYPPWGYYPPPDTAPMPVNPVVKTGWVCPHCGKGVSPTLTHCPCK